ncbi:unnamed protein product [Caenorhabditis angaria]|uniref:F-box domain-containing protein n=1 Tax=Caenorhabditis angaria TaxID=860376 RepID=A0A9P1I9X1_9PELO|nr:unnamed protein product [Caenorhabditis angaria]
MMRKILCAKRKKSTGAKLVWDNLPEKFKIQVIEYLDLASKARFSRCSKNCEIAVLGSKNYLKSIKFSEPCWDRFYQIRLEYFGNYSEVRMDYYDLHEEDEDDQVLYKIEFYIDDTLTYEWEIKHFDLNYPFQRFQKLIDNSKYLESIEFDYYKTLIYQNFKNMEKLQHLETLRIYDRRHQKEELCDNEFENFALVNNLRKNIICPIPSLNLRELLQITARKSRIYDVEITPKTLKSFILAVKDGKIDENIKKLRLDYHRDQEPWDPEVIFQTRKGKENLKVDVLNKETDPDLPDAIWFDLNIKGKPERYAKFRMTEKSFLMVIRLQEKREHYRWRAIEWRGEFENDDELDGDSYEERISEFDREEGVDERSDYEF